MIQSNCTVFTVITPSAWLKCMNAITEWGMWIRHYTPLHNIIRLCIMFTLVLDYPSSFFMVLLLHTKQWYSKEIYTWHLPDLTCSCWQSSDINFIFYYSLCNPVSGFILYTGNSSSGMALQLTSWIFFFNLTKFRIENKRGQWGSRCLLLL